MSEHWKEYVHPPSNDCEQLARLLVLKKTLLEKIRSVFLCQVSVKFYCFSVIRFMMPEKNLFYTYLIMNLFPRPGDLTPIALRPFFVIGLQGRLSHAMTAKHHAKRFTDWSMTFLQGEFKYFRRLLLFLQDNRLLILQLLIVKIENANNTTETPTHREQRQTKSIFGLFGYWRHKALDW